MPPTSPHFPPGTHKFVFTSDTHSILEEIHRMGERQGERDALFG